ncbi:MAG: penicillin-binding transpeptidase domain-containing protein, partial [Acutalibacteraceae bacterium]|nr:penicillin-binding transpeptidase domain-containing protein [Acutalibacteraceae bacterium]
LNVKTGGILAAVNYPTYTYEEYENDYESLVKNTTERPLFDRAFTGTYPPGSTFKPAVACAALQEGVITADETITCVRKYRHFKDYQPNCMHFHGGMTLIPALSKSCNYFFFETGRRLGITKMNSYCKKLGLGVKTGVEVSESAGILAGPESRDEWYEGYTLSAAIGQSDNAFTPLQLAAYTATIANSGVRYKTTLIDKVMSYSQDEVISESKPEIADTVKLDENVINTVKKGMLSVTEDGTGSRVFADYPITVGGKTGTAETTTGADHTVFIAFAPYENPEIAVAVIIEHGKYSSYSGGLLKAIFNAYFFTELQNQTESPSYELLP